MFCSINQLKNALSSDVDVRNIHVIFVRIR